MNKNSFRFLFAAISLALFMALSLDAVAAKHGVLVAVAAFGALTLACSPTPSAVLRAFSPTAGLRNNVLHELDFALPNGAAAAYSTDIDLGALNLPENVEFQIEIPAATTGEAPDTRTLTVDIVAGSAASPTTQASRAVVYTGAGGAGFATSQNRFGVARNAGRYLRARAVGGTSFGNMSGKNGTLRILG
jgi:hypothetical protein